MRWSLPPLNALRSFEAAARLKSFSEAAEELGVTPGAVSRQIAKLEDFLGTSLFSRSAREVSLTPVGAEYQEMANTVFATVHRETGRIRKGTASGELTIWSSMTVSMRWLVPYLTDYYARAEGMEVALTTSIRPLIGHSREFDFALRYGHGVWPGFATDLLFTTDLVPVCAPALAAEFATGTPKDLVGKTLLHSQVRATDWETYCNAAGLSDVNASTGAKFESSAIAYQAAAQGMGVALGQRRLVQDDLETGRLVTPISFSIPSDGGFYLIYLPETLRRKPARAFRNWIRGVAEAEAKKA